MAYRPNIKNADGSLTDLPIEAETAVKLKSSRSIGLSGVTATAQSFNGTAAISIPITAIPASLLYGVGNIDITGNAGSANKLSSKRNISLSGVTATVVQFDGTEDVSLVISGIPASLLYGVGNIDITGNAGSATRLATARTIGVSGVTGTAQSFNGTANIVIPITAVPASLLTGTIASDRLPVATSGVKGAVKGGGNVTIAADGTMTANTAGSGITVTARPGLGNLTNLDAVLNYISNVFMGLQAVTMLKAAVFDTTA